MNEGSCLCVRVGCVIKGSSRNVQKHPAPMTTCPVAAPLDHSPSHGQAMGIQLEVGYRTVSTGSVATAAGFILLVQP